jgi:photosystem II stability/assembly factor-like uncharacterized protein
VEVYVGEEDDGSHPRGRARPGMYHLWGSLGKADVDRDHFKLEPKFAEKVGASDKQKDEGMFVDRDYQCHSIVYCDDENGKPAIMTAISGVLDSSGIWLSKSRDGRWEQLTRGLPPGREFGRTSLAVSEKDRKIVYAFVGSADGTCLGVFRTSDGGKHWTSSGPDHFVASGRLNYTNCIAVHPKNPDLVVCGADDLHRSTDGGQTWAQVTEWFAARNSPGYAHKDHHALLWLEKEPDQPGDDPNLPGNDPEQHYRLYSGNDGGIDSSDDGGITWAHRSKGLANLMFYDIDVAPSSVSDSLIIAGGTQDNASVMTEIEASGVGYIPTELGVQLTQLGVIRAERVNPAVGKEAPREIAQLDAASRGNIPSVCVKYPERNEFADILYGDGGWIVFDPKTPLHLYGSSQFMTIYRHRVDDGWVIVTPEDATDDERGNTWMAFIAMHPLNSNIVFTGSTRLWRTQNDGDDWKAVTDYLDGRAISAIEISDAKPSVIYVGTENGNIFMSDDGGNRWSWQDGEPGPTPLDWRRDVKENMPATIRRSITRIEADPNDSKIVFATLLGYEALQGGRARRGTGGVGSGADDGALPLASLPYPHVIWFDKQDKDNQDKPKDRPGKWKDANDGNLPNVHHNVVTWSGDPKAKPIKPSHVFVGNDVGVWMGTRDAEKPSGWTWHDISGNLPNVIVTDLVYHRESYSLTAATYGRGIWHLKLDD